MGPNAHEAMLVSEDDSYALSQVPLHLYPTLQEISDTTRAKSEGQSLVELETGIERASEPVSSFS